MTTINTDIDDDFDDDEIFDINDSDYQEDALDDLEQESYMTYEEENRLFKSYMQSARELGADDQSATTYASYRMDGYSKEHAMILSGLADPQY